MIIVKSHDYCYYDYRHVCSAEYSTYSNNE